MSIEHDNAPLVNLMNEYEKLADVAKQLAVEAAQIVDNAKSMNLSIDTKSSTTDMVTDIDKTVERYLCEKILHKYPNHSIVAEESGQHKGSSEISWVIDPIDGTTNLIYGFPAYSISIGIKHCDDIVAGVVYSITDGSMYWASKGGSAFKNKNQIHVRKASEVSSSLIGTGFGYSARRRVAQSQFLSTIISEVRDIRRAGAASLDICYVAEGRLDGYYESGLWPWDYTAATLIAREAGGIVKGLSDEPNDDLTISASNQILADFLTAKLRPHVPFPI